MECLDYKNNVMHMDDINLKELASKHGTPLYVYSKKYLEDRFNQFNTAIIDKDLLVCYAVKANSNIAILQLMAKMGAGFDIVSCGELSRVIKAGGDPKKVVYSGVAKSEQDIKFALDKGILCFNVESEAELLRINEVACSLNKQASISIRVNPDVDAKTHPYISTGLKNNKFGVQIDKAFELYNEVKELKKGH
jgi:diaminopimelate decarboxylase